MNSKDLPSRRDWFRLKWNQDPPKKQTTPNNGAPKLDTPKPSLKPVADPVNHGGVDLSELPPMRQAILTADQVKDLFDDVGAFGENIELMIRSENGKQSPDLQAACQAILSGTVSRLQVRYHWKGKYWIDTLQKPSAQTALPASALSGFQLIRIAHPGVS